MIAKLRGLFEAIEGLIRSFIAKAPTTPTAGSAAERLDGVEAMSLSEVGPPPLRYTLRLVRLQQDADRAAREARMAKQAVDRELERLARDAANAELEARVVPRPAIASSPTSLQRRFPSDVGEAGRGVKVLIVAGEAHTRILIQKLLERWGYCAAVACDVKEAWKLFEEEEYPIVIQTEQESRITNSDAADLIHRIRACQRPGYVYIILAYTPFGEPKGDLLEAFEAGIDDFLTIPLDFDELKARLRAGERIVQTEGELRKAKEAVEAARTQELTIARAIQMRLLPPTRMSLQGYEVVSRSEPALEVGGDFYNLFELGKRSGVPAPVEPPASAPVGVLLGDVSGKGVPGALFMALTTTLIEGQAQVLHSPAETLAAANAALYPKMRRPVLGQPSMFATAVYGVLDPTHGEIRLANAGQIPPILWPASGEPRYVRSRGLPLGALPGSTYEEHAIHMAPGDRLLFCSDGFIEERGADGEPVGYDGFLRCLAGLGQQGGAELIEALFASDDASSADLLDRDDRTCVLITALEVQPDVRRLESLRR